MTEASLWLLLGLLGQATTPGRPLLAAGTLAHPKLPVAGGFATLVSAPADW